MDQQAPPIKPDNESASARFHELKDRVDGADAAQTALKRHNEKLQSAVQAAISAFHKAPTMDAFGELADAIAVRDKAAAALTEIPKIFASHQNFGNIILDDINPTVVKKILLNALAATKERSAGADHALDAALRELSGYSLGDSHTLWRQYASLVRV